MNRILSGDEQSKYYSDIWQRHDTDGLLAAQLAKTDKEWVEWIQSLFEKNGDVDPIKVISMWKERKKELGYELL